MAWENPWVFWLCIGSRQLGKRVKALRQQIVVGVGEYDNLLENLVESSEMVIDAWFMLFGTKRLKSCLVSQKHRRHAE